MIEHPGQIYSLDPVYSFTHSTQSPDIAQNRFYGQIPYNKICRIF